MRTNGLRTAVRAALVLASLTAGGTATADESIIKNPGDHPDYRFEAEPHGLIGFAGPFESGRADFGGGFRGTIIIVDTRSYNGSNTCESTT